MSVPGLSLTRPHDRRALQEVGPPAQEGAVSDPGRIGEVAHEARGCSHRMERTPRAGLLRGAGGEQGSVSWDREIITPPQGSTASSPPRATREDTGARTGPNPAWEYDILARACLPARILLEATLAVSPSASSATKAPPRNALSVE